MELATGDYRRLCSIAADRSRHFAERGRAIKRIRDRRMYRAEFANFHQFCVSRCGFGGKRGYQFISSTEAFDEIASDGAALYAPKACSAQEKGSIPIALRWLVWERDDFTCHYCGTRRHLSIDHIEPESAGGDLSPSNLITCCKSCNSKKGAKSYEGFTGRERPGTCA